MTTRTPANDTPPQPAHRPPGPVMLDVAGKTLLAEDVARLQHPLTGGVILFSRNFESRAQLVALTREIRSAKPGILIAVDHEGGRVQRFRSDGFTRLPAMRKLGDLWDFGDAEAAVRAARAATAAGYVLAAELVACGIDLSFTPVLDLDYGASSVIGDRSFHRDPRVVALLAASLSHGLLLAGMANCGKHFPGHGYVAADSHHAIPEDERPLEAILETDAKPYQWLLPALAGVMPAHVVYSRVDPAPAGFSPFWLKEILRGRFGFTGVIFSDDLSMEGARVAGTVVEGAHCALAAGCDMVLICNAPDRADDLLKHLRCEPDPDSSSRTRALSMRSGGPQDWEQLQEDARYLKSKKILAEAELIQDGE